MLFTGIHHTKKINRGPHDPTDNFQPFPMLGHQDTRQISIRGRGAVTDDGTVMVVPVRFKTEIAMLPPCLPPALQCGQFDR